MFKPINKVTVERVPIYGGEKDNRPIKGEELFSEIYSNIFICARKQSGKSSVIYTILKKCTTKDTKILAFVSTLHKDNTWLQIQHMCSKKGLYFEGHTSLKDDEGIDQLDLFIKAEQEPPPEEEPETKLLLLDDEPEKERKSKSKYLGPEWIIILDDLSTELKAKSLVSLLKKNRHLKAKVIISSQYLNDLLPEARKQIDYFLLFGSLHEDKLKTIYKDADISVDYDEFKRLYQNATKEKYNFFYIDTRKDEFRRNFNYLIES